MRFAWSSALPADRVADVSFGACSTEDNAALLLVTNAHDLAVAPGIGDDYLMPAVPQLDVVAPGICV
jgi:hypothetical protein